MKNLTCIVLLSAVVLASCQQPTDQKAIPQEKQETKTKFNGEYFGELISPKPVLFAEGFVSTPLQELNAAFSPDGKEFCKTIADPFRTKYLMVRSKRNDAGEWSDFEAMPFNVQFGGADPFYSPDGKRIYFISTRPAPSAPSAEKTDYDIWYAEKEGSDWSQTATWAGSDINTDGNEFYVSVSAKGTICFSASREGGLGAGDVYFASPKEGGGYEIENAGEAINTEFSEGDPFLSPNEDYLIFGQWGDPTDKGRGDLHISFKKDGKWMPHKNLGDDFNTGDTEYCPIVSPDGTRFFWTSYSPKSASEANAAEKFSTQKGATQSVEDFVGELETTLNGMGNIWSVGTERLMELKD